MEVARMPEKENDESSTSLDGLLHHALTQKSEGSTSTESASSLQKRALELGRWTREQRAIAEDQLDELLRSGSHEEVCGKNPLVCRGTVYVDRFLLDCPRHIDGTCPWLEERETAWREGYLRSHGFGKDLCNPMMRRVPADVRPTFGQWLAQLEEHLAEGHGLTICGEVGRGKTGMLALVAYRIGKLKPPRLQDFVGAPAFFRALAAGDTYRYSILDVLMVDDLGTEGLTGYEQSNAMSAFDELIDGRYHQQMPTFITSNLTGDVLNNSAKLARVMSRLRARNLLLQIGDDMPEQREQLRLEADSGG
jgi:DNA replication protein DnaC